MMKHGENIYSFLNTCCKKRKSGKRKYLIQYSADRYWILVHFRKNGVTRTQGYKLHISATWESAIEILKACLPTFEKYSCSFKVLSNTKFLSRLDAPLSKRSQVGKFITVYPRSNHMAVKIAVTLHEATSRFSGPRIPSDNPLKSKSLVHYRYGSFIYKNRVNPLGELTPMIFGPKGRLRLDKKAPWFNDSKWAPDPFERTGVLERHVEPGPIGHRYRISAALSQQPKGGTYLAEDAVEKRMCVVKEARHHTQVDNLGKDACDRLVHEHYILSRLGRQSWAPIAYDFFRQEGNSYLVTNYFNAPTLRSYVKKRCLEGKPLVESEIDRIIQQMACILKHAHGMKIIVRDFNPNNCLISDRFRVFLVDWEIAMDLNEDTNYFQVMTPGYAPPQQYRGKKPTPADDIFSLGSILFFLMTGCHPYFGQTTKDITNRAEQVITLLRPEMKERYLKIIRNSMSARAELRYQSILEFEDEYFSNKKRCFSPVKTSFPVKRRQPDFLFVAKKVGDKIVKNAGLDKQGKRFWHSRSRIGQETLATNFHSGASGIGMFLADLYIQTKLNSYKDCAIKAAEWILHRINKRDELVPNLFCGDLGPVVFFLRLYHAVQESCYLREAAGIAQKLTSISTLPDIMHGVAGQGLVFLALSILTKDKGFEEYAKMAGERLLKTARETENGYVWPFPKTAPGDLAGKVFYGYAHGNAGIGYFLFELFRRTGLRKYFLLGRGAASELLGAARPFLPSGRGLQWPQGPKLATVLPYWCNGAPGIGQFFSQAHKIFPQEEYKRAARGAAETVSLVSAGLSPVQCHGVAGNGELLIDVSNTFKDEEYHSKASFLGKVLKSSRFLQNNKYGYFAGGGGYPTPDFMVGDAGVGHFFLRLNNPGMPRAMTMEYFVSDGLI